MLTRLLLAENVGKRRFSGRAVARAEGESVVYFSDSPMGSSPLQMLFSRFGPLPDHSKHSGFSFLRISTMFWKSSRW